jgi:hypothetical protein
MKIKLTKKYDFLSQSASDGEASHKSLSVRLVEFDRKTIIFLPAPLCSTFSASFDLLRFGNEWPASRQRFSPLTL